ncbi:NADH dehydrogenase (ubiquinone) MLRQ subunit [Brevipalpus obovatus]|uniref:NADH dehydrogenase (ubiquinone) MLRQ subunit n=1 Tax=Brevipalpus obovatus TaxID=246614 RepID=UPI003D9F4337
MSSEDLKGAMQAIKKTPAIWPILGLTGLAMVGAAAYLTRLALATPDGSGIFNRMQEPFQRYENKKYRFLSHFDYENTKHPRPRFEGQEK